MVKRNDLVIGISTSGGFPALSKKIRQKLEGIFPENFGHILETLKNIRKKAEIQIVDPSIRSKALNAIADEVLSYKDLVTDAKLLSRIDDIINEYKEE